MFLFCFSFLWGILFVFTCVIVKGQETHLVTVTLNYNNLRMDPWNSGPSLVIWTKGQKEVLHLVLLSPKHLEETQGTQSVVAMRGVTQRYSLSLEMRARLEEE